MDARPSTEKNEWKIKNKVSNISAEHVAIVIMTFITLIPVLFICAQNLT